MTEITAAPDWEGIRARFRWQLPVPYNLAEDMVGRWARSDPGRLALLHLPAEGEPRDYSFLELERAACRMANVLEARGIYRGDRVAVLLSQSPEVLLTHLAAYKIGAIVVPLFTLFGPEGLEFRLTDSDAQLLVTDRASLPKIAEIRGRLPGLQHVLSADGAGDGAEALGPLLEAARDSFETAATGPDDPAFISYTSGTTGPPKGALHAHRVLLGHMPAVQLTHELFPQEGDAMWTPADWAWMGGLCNVAMPCLRFGVPLLSHRMERFDPERAFWLLEAFQIRNSFLPPTALKLMRAAGKPAKSAPALRSVGSGGESLGAELLDWGRETFGLTINEFYGQTECNLVLGNCASRLPVRPGSMGKPFPGSEVAILGPEGEPLPPGEAGEIAVRRGDAAMFLRYWKAPRKTAEKFAGDWMLTGDEGVMDEDGYFHFASRSDDVITSSGYRIGPTEIEHCLTGHPAVAMAAVVGVPDPVRTEIVKAFVTLAPGHAASEALAEALRAHVKARLSPHLAPREVAFIERMPTTATGKIRRRDLRGA
ncbi:acyl-CoA synthetase [Paralimibaculum aggregatum]|uniref:Acyl-CoA synthetase n=1 Tax=Paralimibaculum aggregatum TaxID=3036245 RepID=A0ABQ6LMP5_9RHOB|nr:AMP-binding protein [Limibaculum sp. NKW23]GMG83570.1 acyl-CoA synthetase [Limibaculum sp. NKW23]